MLFAGIPPYLFGPICLIFYSNFVVRSISTLGKDTPRRSDIGWDKFCKLKGHKIYPIPFSGSSRRAVQDCDPKYAFKMFCKISSNIYIKSSSPP